MFVKNNKLGSDIFSFLNVHSVDYRVVLNKYLLFPKDANFKKVPDTVYLFVEGIVKGATFSLDLIRLGYL